MDADGYPTEAELRRITEWSEDLEGWFAYIKRLWWSADWGWHEETIDGRQRVQQYAISTGGWSGNEAIIAAMQQNQAAYAMAWYSSRRGGHYVFRCPVMT